MLVTRYLVCICRSGTAYPVRILVFVQTALSLVFTYSLFPRLTPAGILGIYSVCALLDLIYSDSLRAVHTPDRGNPLLSLRAIADGATIHNTVFATANKFIITGSPRSLYSLAMTKRGHKSRTSILSLRAIADGVAIHNAYLPPQISL